MKKYNAIIILGILAFIVLLPNIWDNSNSTEARINSEQAWSNLSESDYELARHNKMAKSLFESLRQIIEPGQAVRVVMAEVPKTDGKSGDVYYKTNIPEDKLRQYARENGYSIESSITQHLDEMSFTKQNIVLFFTIERKLDDSFEIEVIELPLDEDALAHLGEPRATIYY